MGDFNAEVSETSFSSFCELYEVKSIINQSTCYKNPTNPSCIDLFLTNSPNSFQKSAVIDRGLSDFITYRKYTNFDKDKFIDEISFNLPKHNLQELTLEAFISMFKIVFEKHAMLKKKYLRANQRHSHWGIGTRGAITPHFNFQTKQDPKASVSNIKHQGYCFFMGVQKLHGPEVSRFLPCML